MQPGARLQRWLHGPQRRVIGLRVGDGVVGLLEHQQHAVGLVDLQAAVARQQLARGAVVRRPDDGHGGIAQCLGQRGAVDDIGEQESADFGHRGGSGSQPWMLARGPDTLMTTGLLSQRAGRASR